MALKKGDCLFRFALDCPGFNNGIPGSRAAPQAGTKQVTLTYKPYSAVRATRETNALFLRAGNVHWPSVPESAACSPVASSSHTACSSPGPAPVWAQCGEVLGTGGRALQVPRSCCAQQTGPRVAAARLFLRMIEHPHPSVVNGPSPFPASLASA